MAEHIGIKVEGGVMSLVFQRPDKKNAITNAMYGRLADGLEQAENDASVRVVLFESEGDSFSAGNDLGDFLQQNAAGARPEDLHVLRLLKALARAEKPLVAAVTGQAVGIGVTLLLHCDLVYVARDARLSTPFVNLALVPEAASSLLLPAAIGHRRAFAMFALGEAIDGETAAAWGVANAALDPDEVRPTAREAARLLAARPPGALALTKRLMRDAEALAARIDLESRHFAERLSTAEAGEALQAFFQRRPPNFSSI